MRRFYLALFVLCLFGLSVNGQVTISEQNFNSLSASGTSTTDMVTSGSALTNSASMNAAGSGLEVFTTFWNDTRGETTGPVTATGDASDFIGVNSFAGGNAPDVAPDGTTVGFGTEHNFEFNDGDGELQLVFGALDLSGYNSRTLMLKYWINDDSYESGDRMRVMVSDGMNDIAVLDLSDAGLNLSLSADDGTANWRMLNVDLDATISLNSLDETNIVIQVWVDNNASGENIFIDDVKVQGELAVAGCDELFFSEYVEGSSNNKYIEVYNPTSSAVDLSNYELRLYTNGAATPSTTNTLSGMLPAGEVIVYSNSGATVYEGATTDASAVNFNGDDAMALYNTSTGMFADIFGQIGCDPGSQWGVTATNETQDQTLRRNTDITSGVTTNPGGPCGTSSFATLDTEWTEFAQNDVSGLGFHDVDACESAPDCFIGNVIADTPECDGDESYFGVTFDVVGGSGEYTVINPANTMLYGTALGTGITDGNVSADGQADLPAPEGMFAELVIVDAINETCRSTPITIFVPVCELPEDCPVPADAFINEIHYDNVGGDVNEFVEVAVANSYEGDLSTLTVTLYNGSNGLSYGSATLDNFTEGSSDGDYTFYTMMIGGFGVTGIQNGSPDGLSLDCQGFVLEFLSYEGDFTAADGPAAGMESTDIGVEETGAQVENGSLQLFGGIDAVNLWVVTACNTKGNANANNPPPAAPVPAITEKAFCQNEDLGASLANTGVSVDNTLGPDERVVWVLTAVPGGSAYSVGDEFTSSDCAGSFNNYGELAVANSSRVIRVQTPGTAPVGTYEFEAYVENCLTGCTSAAVGEFSITVYAAPTVEISADPDGDLCLGTMDVQYDAAITSTDGGTYSYMWCAYNSGDGSGTCFNGFSDNTAQDPTRSWTSSAGSKSVGVTVMSDVLGCEAEDLYSFEVVAPTMVECPMDQTVTLVTDPNTFDCAAVATFDNPSVTPGPCDPVVLTISVDGGAPETVTPGEEYTATFDALGVYTVVYTLVDAVGNTSTCSFTITVEGLPCGWVGKAIGCDDAMNAYSYDPATETFSATANNCALTGWPFTSDQFAFICTELCGDGEIIARVSGVTGTGFGGVMIRDDVSPSSPFMAMGTNRVNKVLKQVRILPAYPAFPQFVLAYDQFWVRVVRQGNQLMGFASVDGVMWIPYLNQQVFLTNTCTRVGMFTYSEKPGNPITATFDNVQVIEYGSFLAGLPNGNTTNGTVLTPEVNIYPNPAFNQVTVEMGELVGQTAEIRILNNVGQLVKQVQIDEVQFSEQLEVSDLIPGVYNVVIKAGDALITERLLITRP